MIALLIKFIRLFFCITFVIRQKQYLKTTALKQMRQEVWGDLSDNGVLDLLKQYLQASSALSFASRGQRFNDSDLSELHVRAGDYVSLNFYRRKGYLIAGFPVQQVNSVSSSEFLCVLMCSRVLFNGTRRYYTQIIRAQLITRCL